MNKHVLTIILTTFLCFLGLNLYSMPAVPWPVEKQLSDGTTVSVYLRGDERVHWMESLDGYTLMYNSNKDIVYATVNAEGDMVPSQLLYTSDKPKSFSDNGIKKGLRYSLAQVDMLTQMWNINEIYRTPQKVKGDKKALCILVDFTNRKFEKSIEDFEMLMNQVGYSAGTSNGSVKDYYREASYGQMDLTVSVVGIYTLPNTTRFYAEQMQEFAEISIRMADEDVDYSEFANEDNVLETVHIIYAGYADNVIGNGMQIWPHKWNIYPSFELDGVQISDYSCSSELRGANGTTMTGIGTICHELCHVFGAPDYYDTDYYDNGYYPATGQWDLMATGGHNADGDLPAHINMFQKILFEWVEPIYLTEPITVTNMPNSAEHPVAYVIPVGEDGGDESYILENRQLVGFDKGLPDHGLLIYHTHPNILDPVLWERNTLNAKHPQSLYVVDSKVKTAILDSRPLTYGRQEEAPFGKDECTAFSGTTVPAMFTWEDMSPIDKPLTNIVDGGILVSFDFMGGAGNEPAPVTNLDGWAQEEAVYLEWEAPNSEEEYTYIIYHNGKKILENLTETHCTITPEKHGAYLYGVVAVKEGRESKPEWQEVVFGPFQVISYTPQSTTDVAVDAEVSILFNQLVEILDADLISITDAENTNLENLSIEAKTSNLQINHPDFEYNTLYYVTIPVGAIANCNKEIKWSFRTEKAGLQYLSLFPENNAKHVLIDTDIRVKFNQTISGKDPNGVTITTADSSLANVKLQVSSDELIIKHDDFAYNTTYTVTVKEGTIEGQEKAIVWQFTTGYSVNIDQVNAGDVKVYPSITEGLVNIKSSGDSRLSILDLSGRLINKLTFVDEYELDMDYSKGVYVLLIENAQGQSVHKVILNR